MENLLFLGVSILKHIRVVNKYMLKMENLLFLGVPILKHIRVVNKYMLI